MKRRALFAMTFLLSTAAAAVGFFEAKSETQNPIARPSCNLLISWTPDGSGHVTAQYMHSIGSPIADCERTKKVMVSTALTNILRSEP